MKHLNNYKIFETKDNNLWAAKETRKEEIKYSIWRHNITNYTINDDGSVDVDGPVNLYNKGLTELPFKFNKVSGFFNCADNNLTSLEGCPEQVGGYFDCNGNKLTSLKGSPSYIYGAFYCGHNNITSLEGCPEYVRGVFSCNGNPIYKIIRYLLDRDDRDTLIELLNYFYLL